MAVVTFCLIKLTVIVPKHLHLGVDAAGYLKSIKLSSNFTYKFKKHAIYVVTSKKNLLICHTRAYVGADDLKRTPIIC